MRVCYSFSGLLMLITISLVQGYEEYAPASLCPFPNPHHGTHQPQTSASPVSITVNATTYNPGDYIQVNMSGGEFEGFMIRAMSQDADWFWSQGSFQTIPSNTKAYTYYGDTDSCLGHHGDEKREELVLVWQAPSSNVGGILFMASVAEGYEDYWINITSPVIAPVSPATGLSQVSMIAPQSSTTFDDSTCGSTHGCMYYPNNCKLDKNCEAAAKWQVNGSNLNIEMWSADGDWISFGMSDDVKMGKDPLFLCGESNGLRSVQLGYNVRLSDEPYYFTHPKHPAGITANSYGVARSGKKVWCDLETPATYTMTTIDDKSGVTGTEMVSLLGQDWYLFLAWGSFYDGSPAIMQHIRLPAVSISKASLSSTDIVKSEAVSKMIKAHGALTLVGWLWLAAAGVLLARHRRVAGDRKCLGKACWIQMHQVFLYSGIILTVPGIILAFVFRGGFTTYAVTHSVFGLITTGFGLINLIVGIARPDGGAKTRPIFLWAHRIVAILSILFAIITSFLSVTLSQLPPSLNVGAGASLGVWLFIILAVEVFLEVQNHLMKKRGIDPTDHKGMSISEDQKPPCGGNKFASILFVATLCLIFVPLLAVIVLVGIS